MALMMSTIEIGIETGESARDRPLPCFLRSSTHPSHLCKQKNCFPNDNSCCGHYPGCFVCFSLHALKQRST